MVELVQKSPCLLLAVDVVAVALVGTGRPLHDVDAVVLPHLFVGVLLTAAPFVLQQLFRLLKAVGPKCRYEPVHLWAVLGVAAWVMPSGLLVIR